MYYNPYSLERKTIFVTGASSGIGKAIAIECSKMGAFVIVSGRNEMRLKETFNTLEGEGHLQIIADLESNQDIQHIIDKIPTLDGIVHCAGFTKTVPFQFITPEDLSTIMRVNFTAPVLISRDLIRKNKLKKGASIVFISSISGVLLSLYGNSMYSASKGAVNGIVKGMALDLASKSIRVNAVCPGMIDTDIIKSGVFTEEQIHADSQKYPLKRYGKPEEVAYATIFLLSDAAQWITGSNLLIDGGYTLI